MRRRDEGSLTRSLVTTKVGIATKKNKRNTASQQLTTQLDHRSLCGKNLCITCRCSVVVFLFHYFLNLVLHLIGSSVVYATC